MDVYVNKPILFLLGLSMFWTLCIFIAPLTMPPHTVEHLEGGTSKLDFANNWTNLNFFDRVIYTIGDSQCHQMSERTYYINGNQMPMCSRCVALFLWANLGVVTAMLLIPKYDISQTAAQIYPSKIRNYLKTNNREFQAWVILAALCILTTAIDGFAQLLMPYESTNLKRVIFSIPTGWFGGFAIGLMINNVYYSIKDPELMARSIKPPPKAPPGPKVAKAEKADKDGGRKAEGPPDKGGKKKEVKASGKKGTDEKATDDG